jgi:hypothetical protein
VIDGAVKRFGPFLEKMMVWALDGGESPFIRVRSQPIEKIKNPVLKKKIKFKKF